MKRGRCFRAEHTSSASAETKLCEKSRRDYGFARSNSTKRHIRGCSDKPPTTAGWIELCYVLWLCTQSTVQYRVHAHTFVTESLLHGRLRIFCIYAYLFTFFRLLFLSPERFPSVELNIYTCNCCLYASKRARTYRMRPILCLRHTRITWETPNNV